MLREIRRLGARPGITLNPDTAAERIFGVLPLVDEVLCMTVRPGYGGQSFMPEPVAKIRSLRPRFSKLISVDGGIDPTTAPQVLEAGADVLVAGNAVFGKLDRSKAIQDLRDVAKKYS